MLLFFFAEELYHAPSYLVKRVTGEDGYYYWIEGDSMSSKILAHENEFCRILKPKSEGSLVSNCRVMILPSGAIHEIMICDTPIFVPSGWEACEDVDHDDWDNRAGSQTDNGNLARARRRAVRRINEYGAANQENLDCMVTLTVSPDYVMPDGRKVDRTSYDDVMRVVRPWLSNRVSRNGLMYLGAFEEHDREEDNGQKALHMHLLCNFAALEGKVKYTRRRYEGKDGKLHGVYNVTDWRMGWSTLVKRYGDPEASLGYIAKYIRKGERPIGGRWYLHSQNLQYPSYRYCNVDYRAVQGAQEYKIEAARKRFKVLHGDSKGVDTVFAALDA